MYTKKLHSSERSYRISTLLTMEENRYNTVNNHSSAYTNNEYSVQMYDKTKKGCKDKNKDNQSSTVDEMITSLKIKIHMLNKYIYIYIAW